MDFVDEKHIEEPIKKHGRHPNIQRVPAWPPASACWAPWAPMPCAGASPGELADGQRWLVTLCSYGHLLIYKWL